MQQPIIVISVVIGIVILSAISFGIYQLLQPGSAPSETSTLEVGASPVLPIGGPAASEEPEEFVSDLPQEDFVGGGPIPEIQTGGEPAPISTPVPSPIVAPLEETLSPDAVPPPGFTRASLSVYYQKVHFGATQIARQAGETSSFSLSADGALVKPVDITGWRLKTNRGEVSMPQAIQYYGPFGGIEKNIVLAPGEYVNVYSNTNPLGKNFRLNRCMGFLNSVYEFIPSIPEQCPDMYSRDELVTLSGDCQEFILQFNGCRAPTAEELNFPIVLNNTSCRTFLERLNYGACYNRHNALPDFLLSEWRVYLGREIPFDTLHDRVLIFDAKGLLVDYYVY